MSNVLDDRDTERAFRKTIDSVSAAKRNVETLVEGDLTGGDLLNDLDAIIAALETDRETLRDWLR